jgi:hypothetical protein
MGNQNDRTIGGMADIHSCRQKFIVFFCLFDEDLIVVIGIIGFAGFQRLQFMDVVS